MLAQRDILLSSKCNFLLCVIKQKGLSVLLFFIIPFGVFAAPNIIHGPYLQAVGETEATIVWITEKPAVSWVELAPADNSDFYAFERPRYYQTLHGNSVVGKVHKVTITGLVKGTEYRYRVFSKEVLEYPTQHAVLYGTVSSTDVYGRQPLRFTTFDKDKPEVSFVVVNDIHGNTGNLKALCKNVAYRKTDLVIFNGDMVQMWMDNEKQLFANFMDEAVNLFAKETPVVYARGNHETRGKFNMFFSDYFSGKSGKLYYSFRQGSIYFIILDSGEDKPDSDIEYSGLAHFDDYITEQQEWLKNVVQSEDFRSAKYRIVMSHIPPASEWHGERRVSEKYLSVLNHVGITAMFSGHWHRYDYFDSNTAHDYPILVNSNVNALEVKINDAEMSVKVMDTEGKEVKEFTYRSVKQ